MKKLFILIAVLTLSFTLTGCGGEESLPDEMTMAELDEFLGRDDVQYVDLRNFDEKLISGYILGFESIPYFDYLKYNGILNDSNGGWVFDDGEVLSTASMRAIFDEDKTILLMCGSGTRAQYVMDALLSLDYTDVINIGGYADYVTAEGDAVVLGGTAFQLDLHVKGDYTPGTYVGFDEDSNYFVTVVINVEGGIGSVVFDAVSGDSTKQALGGDYNMRTLLDLTWAETTELLSEAIVSNQGWDTDWVIVEGKFDLAVVDIAETTDVDETNVGDADTIDAVAGVTISVDGLLVAWLEAIALADAE